MSLPYTYEYFNITFPQQYIAVVEINRPAKLNAFIKPMWINLGSIFARLSHDPDVRVVLLTAAGEKAFSTGLDIQAASAGLGKDDQEDGARAANRIRRYIMEFQDCITQIEKCEKPVIALLHGLAYGLALDIALAADIRISTANVKFCVKEVDIGIAADIGTLSRLPHANVPMSFVNEVCLTARVFSGTETGQVGLVSQVIQGGKEELVKRGLELGKVIAEKSPVAVIGTKEILKYSKEHGITDGLKYTSVWNAAYTQTKDVKDSILAGLTKKKTTYAKL